MTNKPETEVATVAENVLDDAALTAWQGRIGVEMRISNIFNQNASFEAIRNYSNGIGDDNPLYRDAEYGKKTRFGAMVASPGTKRFRLSLSLGLSCNFSTKHRPKLCTFLLH